MRAAVVMAFWVAAIASAQEGAPESRPETSATLQKTHWGERHQEPDGSWSPVGLPAPLRRRPSPVHRRGEGGIPDRRDLPHGAPRSPLGI